MARLGARVLWGEGQPGERVRRGEPVRGGEYRELGELGGGKGFGDWGGS